MSFKYIGGIVNEGQNGCRNHVLLALLKALRFNNLSRKTEIMMYLTVIRPIVMYGETWTVIKERSKALLVWEKRVLSNL